VIVQEALSIYGSQIFCHIQFCRVGILEDPGRGAARRLMFKLSVVPEKAPDNRYMVELRFHAREIAWRSTVDQLSHPPYDAVGSPEQAVAPAYRHRDLVDLVENRFGSVMNRGRL